MTGFESLPARLTRNNSTIQKTDRHSYFPDQFFIQFPLQKRNNKRKAPTKGAQKTCHCICSLLLKIFPFFLPHNRYNVCLVSSFLISRVTRTHFYNDFFFEMKRKILSTFCYQRRFIVLLIPILLCL